MANRIFGNRYQVTEKIGMGGMAEVFKATDSTLGRTVAVKVMLPQYAADPNFAARFRQEAQAAANLNSPYIVNIYDWGKDQDSYYIVMEYVRGTDLKTAIQQRGKIHPRKVAEIGSQVCSALSVAHGYDIIHRDIKSANIMVQADGNVKVMDFGIAQAGRPGMTTDSSVLGTAHYVSPEQAQGKHLAATSDLYSLGVVMYEAATGQLPFDGPDVVSVAMKQVSETPVPPRDLNPDIDPRLEAIILKAMEKDPANRYQTANEMKRALDDYLMGRGSAAPTQVVGAAVPGDYAADKTTVMSPETAEAATKAMNAAEKGGKGAGKKKSKKGRIIAAVIIVILLAAAGIAVAASQGVFGGKVNVPSVTGMTQEDATTELTNSNLQLGDVTLQASNNVDKGKVISQDPAANTSVDKQSKVNLVVSSGKDSEKKAVPNLMGLTAAEAEKSLAAVGLKGSEQTGSSNDVSEGEIFSQDPEAFTQVAAGSTVTYTVSTGTPSTSDDESSSSSTSENDSITLESYIGVDADSAEAQLTRMGLNVKRVDGKSDQVGEGEVCSQSPSSGSTVKAGSTVTITVSTGSTSTDVPNVVGDSRAEAVAELRNAGFKVTTKYSVGEKGAVISQTPSSGASAKSGATVTITVGTGGNNSGGSTKGSSSSSSDDDSE